MEQPVNDFPASLGEAIDRALKEGYEIPAEAEFKGFGVYYSVKIWVTWNGVKKLFEGKLYGIGAGAHAKGSGVFKYSTADTFEGKWSLIAAFRISPPEVGVLFTRGGTVYGGFSSTHFVAGNGVMGGSGSWKS